MKKPPVPIEVCKCGHSAAEHGYSVALPCMTSPCTCPCFQLRKTI